MLRHITCTFLLMTALTPALPAEPAPTPESQLLLPFFEVSLEGLERMTFFSIANSSSEPIELTATVYTNWAIPIHEVRIVLEAKQVKPVNLHDWIVEGKLDGGDSVCLGGEKDCLDLLHVQKALAGQASPMTDMFYSSELEAGVATGFVTFKADQGFLPESDVLWGDYFYTDPIENFAQGQRLVRLEADLECADLCFRHSVRFLEGGAFTGGTKLTVWSWDGVPNQPSETPAPPFLLDQAELDVYSQQGELVAVIPKDVLPVQTIVVGEDEDLKVAHPFGWFDLSTFRVSAVSGLYRAANRFSVGVPAWCLPCDPCDENGPCYDPTSRDCKCFPAHVGLSGDSSGRVGEPFSMAYNLTGSTPINVRVRDLPAGLTQNGRTIEGVPTETGTFTISADNLCGHDVVEVEITTGIDPGGEAKLTLIKTVVGGPDTPADFQLYVEGAVETRNVRSGDTEILEPGTYTASEENRPGYLAGSWSGDCAADGTVTLAIDDDKTCRITNTYDPARLTLVKHVVNDDGGAAVPSDFPLFVDGQRVASGAVTEVPAGAYVVSEQSLPGYEAGDWGGDCAPGGAVNLAPGDFKVCEITNDDQPATITLVKHVSGGSARVSDFPLYVGGTRVTSGVATKMDPGTYVASEQSLADYTASAWSGDCAADGTVTLALGDDKRCEITNTYVPPPATLTLIKHVVNDDGGTATVGDFDFFVDGAPVVPGQPIELAAGTYRVSESDHPDYKAGPWTNGCNSEGWVTLAPGDDKVCEITNDDKPPACVPDPTFSIWNASVDYNDPHRYSHHTEVRFSFRVGGEVDGEVQLFWRNGGSTYVKKRISIHRDCEDAATEGNLFWESNNKSHHPGHGARYFTRLVIGGQVVESIPLN